MSYKVVERRICQRCGFPKEEDGFALCPDCRGRVRVKGQKARKEAYKSGTCTRCLKAKSEPGRKLCKKCQIEVKTVDKKVVLISFKEGKKDQTVALVCSSNVKTDAALKRFYRKMGDKKVTDVVSHSLL